MNGDDGDDADQDGQWSGGGGAPRAAATADLGDGGGGDDGGDGAVLPLPLQVPVDLVVGNANGTNVNDLVEGVTPPPFVAMKSPKSGTTFSPLPVSLLLLFVFTAIKVWFYSYFK